MRLVFLFLLLPSLAVAQYPRTTVEGRASVDYLDAGRSWQEHTLTVGRRAAARTGVTTSLGWLQRFGATDQRLQLDASVAAGRRLTLGAEGEFSPTHLVVARSGMAARAHVALGRGWGVEGRAAQRRFAIVDVRSASLSVERYWSSWHASMTTTASSVPEYPVTLSYAARLTRSWGERGLLTVGTAAGREVEIPSPGVLLPMDVVSGGTWGALPMTRHLDATFAVAVTRQGTFFTRTHTALGLRLNR